MKVGVSMWSYYRPWKRGHLDILGFIREAKKAGAEGVELLDFFYKDAAVERPLIHELLDELEMPVPIFSVANNFAKTTEGDREAQVDRIRFGVDEAIRYNAKIVRVFAGDVAGGSSFDQARAWIIEGLSEASKYAADRGIKLALENHGSLAGRSDQIRLIIDDVRARSGNDALWANPDMGNFILVGQPSHEAIRDVARYATMCHIKDFAAGEGPFYSLNGQRFVGAVVTEGIVDLEQCLMELKIVNFDGWLSVEFEGDEDPFTAVPRSIEKAKALL